MKKFILLYMIIMMCMFLGVVTGLTYQQESEVDIKFPCYNTTGALCSPLANCNVTLYGPNNVLIFNNSEATNQLASSLYFNITLTPTQTSNNGENCLIAYCCDSGDGDNPCGDTSICFEITPSGNTLSTANGIIYVVFLIGALFVFFLLSYGAIAIPFKDVRNEEGKVVSVNDLKYFKVFFMVLSYIMLMWIFGILYSITSTFLILNGIEKFFYYLFIIMLSFLWPAIVLSLIICLILFIDGKKMRKRLLRDPF